MSIKLKLMKFGNGLFYLEQLRYPHSQQLFPSYEFHNPARQLGMDSSRMDPTIRIPSRPNYQSASGVCTSRLNPKEGKHF